jgi:SAM-dependent methyltransferase
MLASTDLAPGVVLEDAACPMGCVRDDEPVISGVDRISGVGGTFQIVRCRSCRLARTNPRPTPETIGRYYPDEYAPYQYTKGVAGAKPRRSVVRSVARRLIDFNSDHLAPAERGHALEIGCASGAYLAHLASLGWSVEGVELNEAAAAATAARGFRVQTSAVELMAQPLSPPSLVVAWMVLEHLHDPVGALRRLREWSAESAWLVASVPNFATVGASAFKREWYPLQLPAHLFHYDKGTLGGVLARGGWRLERVFYHRTLTDFVASVGNWVESRGQGALAERLRTTAKKRAFHLAMYPFAAGVAALGQTGRMTIWAKRERA